MKEQYTGGEVPHPFEDHTADDAREDWQRDQAEDEWIEQEKARVAELQLLTPEEKAKAFESYPCLDPSFEDDYRTEVELLLETQAVKSERKERDRIKSVICQYGFLSTTENGHGFLVTDRSVRLRQELGLMAMFAQAVLDLLNEGCRPVSDYTDEATPYVLEVFPELEEGGLGLRYHIRLTGDSSPALERKLSQLRVQGMIIYIDGEEA